MNTAKMQFVRRVDASLSAEDIPLAGGKAANLSALSEIGRVPQGFVVLSTAFRRVVANSGAPSAIATLLVSSAGRATQEAAIARVTDLIERSALPDGLFGEIEASLDEMSVDRFAVRSSANVEDTATNSFAGAFRSCLNVPRSEVISSIRQCWISLYSRRSLNYAASRAVDLARAELAVIVQAMLSPESAGVCFTADPVAGTPGIYVVEVVMGLGEGLVSGRVTPHTYWIDSATSRIVREHGPEQETLVHNQPVGGIREVHLKPGGSRAFLREEQVRDLVAVATRIERRFGSPQDIEFAVVGESIYLLQTRPITNGTLGSPN